MVLGGWVFIIWQNRFHVTPPVVIIWLSWLAIVAMVFNLWRTGAVAVAHNEEDDGDASWGMPTGARGELEREKKTLLKAIREAEFDHQMGKLSKADVDGMVRTYRARAIEVIKEIDHLDGGSAGTVREQIQREVRARLAVEDEPARKQGTRGMQGTQENPQISEAARALLAAQAAKSPTAKQPAEAKPTPSESATDTKDAAS